ncbi:hypothetical protein ACTD5D_31405 [Nocardia takedensis]|uniref:hypothetical protein n=1 Tax=Nocardia takedensis TaxID=259390 RepID=UPI003F763754
MAWTGFVFGTVLSVAMNWLHTWLPAEHMPEDWTPGLAPQIMSTVWPLCLLLSVEVLSRVQWREGLTWALARYGGVGTVAAGSAVISYGHVHEVLASWGYGTAGSVVGPLVMDGLMIACGFALLAETPHAAGANRAEPTAAPATSGAEARIIAPRDLDADAAGSGQAGTAPAGHETGRDTVGTVRDNQGDTDRDELIRRMSRAGKSAREIERETGVSKSTVSRIVSRARTWDSPDTAMGQHAASDLLGVAANGEGTM